MTVAITGDVHHMTMATRDQSYLEGTEVEAAIEYAEIAAEYDLPVTLFCTGKCIEEAPEGMQTLAEMANVELGGHNYWAFTTAVHTTWRAIEKLTGGRIGSWNGPRRFQVHEIDRTLDAFDQIGVRLACWRDHAYRHDRHTADLLADRGITHLSDVVEPGGAIRHENSLTVVPINTPPDHEHVYHAFRTPGSAAAYEFEGPFGSECMTPESWVDWVLEHVRSRQAGGETATILAHPACMQLADGFDAFQRLCGTIAALKTDTVSVTEI